jgi:hypothetical protein
MHSLKVSSKKEPGLARLFLEARVVTQLYLQLLFPS